MPPDPSARRPSPVAGAPAAALVRAADDVARAWLVELVARAPLAAATRLRVAELAGEAPTLVAALAEALVADDALARLEPGGDLHGLAARTGALAGATDAAGAADAVEALRSVLWSASLEELRGAGARLVADLADRLAAVCATVTRAALGAGAAAVPPLPVEEAADEEVRAWRPPPTAGERPGVLDAGGARAHRIVRPPRTADEAGPEERPRAVEADPRAHLAARAAEHLADGRAFGVLLVELDGIDRLLAAQTGQEVVRAVEAAEQALEELLRPGDGIRRESLGRLWITLPGAGPAGARALALRAAGAVERAAGHRGAPLTASVGVAICPRDGTDPDELMEAAEDGLLAAQAAGSRGDAPAAT